MTTTHYIIDGKAHVRVSVVIDEFCPPLEQFYPTTIPSAAALGSAMHMHIDNFLQGDVQTMFELKPQLIQFLREHPDWHIHKTEFRISDPEWLIAGTVDALFVTPAGEYILIDWKRTQGLCNESMARYQLQVNLYRVILIRMGFNVILSGLVIMHPKYTKPYFEVVPDVDVSKYTDNARFISEIIKE